MHERAQVDRQYSRSDPLIVRLETHRLYEERPVDLDQESAQLLQLRGDESIIDVGPGPGRFEQYLRASGHRGPLAGIDQSRTMVREARTTLGEAGERRTHWIVGSAEHLPIADGSFDRVVARHMLYHVPEIPVALRAFCRVLRPGGSVLVSTNAERSLPGITDLLSDMLVAFGLPPVHSNQAPFSMSNAATILRSIFDQVETRSIENALVFSEPQPIVRYIATLFPSLPVTDDAAVTSRMLEWLRVEASRRLADHGGIWRDPKDVGFYLCRMTSSHA
ncbi:MAG: class I SAM-dependent methyltransferase [Dehalococcoidia bacterium]